MQIRQMLAIYALDSVNFEAMRKASELIHPSVCQERELADTLLMITD